MVNEALLKSSLQATLRQTDVWKHDTLKFKLNGSGASLDPKQWQSSSPSRPRQGSTGHIPTTTMRDTDLFSQIAGVSQTVTNMAKNAISAISKRSVTCDPFNNQEDSLFVGNLLLVE
jgi:hypothetical protein